MSKIFGIHIPSETKNLAINGNFDFFQRATSNTFTSATASYTADRFTTNLSGTSRNFTVAQSTLVPTVAQSGYQSQYSLGITNNSVVAFAAADYVQSIIYKMEGLDYQKIYQKNVTFGFWFMASVAGTYSFVLQNGAFNRCYVTTFNITGSNTWQYVTLTIAMDTAGTYNFNNTLGLQITIAGVSGTNNQTSTLNSWTSGGYVQASTAVNYFATSGATINIAQFSIVEGTLGFGPMGFQRAGKDIQQELALCQRYYEALNGNQTASGCVQPNLQFIQQYNYKVEKRAIPTITGSVTNINNGTSGAITVDSTTTTAVSFHITAVSGSSTYVSYTVNTLTMDCDL